MENRLLDLIKDICFLSTDSHDDYESKWNYYKDTWAYELKGILNEYIITEKED